jgi:hypothetical protein
LVSGVLVRVTADGAVIRIAPEEGIGSDGIKEKVYIVVLPIVLSSGEIAILPILPEVAVTLTVSLASDIAVPSLSSIFI